MTTKIEYNVQEIFDAIGGEWLQYSQNDRLIFLSLDSRKVTHYLETIFWALKTPTGDGTGYIRDLYRAGVRNFVTQEKFLAADFEGANIIYVPDALHALQLLAIHHRKRFDKIHVFGITGSNGKTIVKEWLYELLSKKYHVVKSPRSFNSQIGVPLSILSIREEHEVGLFEAGISRPEEMTLLEKMIRPDTGVLTNIGPAHDEGFNSPAQKLSEKLKLFVNTKELVYPDTVDEIINIKDVPELARVHKKRSWGNEQSDFFVKNIKPSRSVSDIEIAYEGKEYEFSIPFTDNASVRNAITCFASLMTSGLFTDDKAAGFLKLHPVSMRLEMKPGINHSVIINDSYSNDLDSLAVAVDFLKQQGLKRTTIILSDLLQSGLPEDKLYTQVAKILKQAKPDRLIGIGRDMMHAKDLFAGMGELYFFSSTEEFLENRGRLQFNEEAILVKGARKFSFEKIVRALESQLHKTVLSVNLSNLAYNIRFYRRLLKPETRLMAMVKAFAYGSGSNQIGALLQYINTDYLAVAYVDEGVRIREAGIDLPIMVLNVEQGTFDGIVQYQLEPEIFSFRLLNDFSDYLAERNITDFPVHLKIDTGMHRLGFTTGDYDHLFELLQGNNRIKIKSVFSHFSSSDNPAHDSFTMNQFREFTEFADKLKEVLGYSFYRHISNTAAISRFPDFQLDMVRLGIGMYGVDETGRFEDELKIVNKLSTTVSQIKKVKKGEVVGYGMNVIDEDKTIAIVGIGYADGYRRVLGNGRGKMMINGKTAPTVGNICMDMTMLDITGLNDVREGDEVVVFGEGISVRQVAEWAGTISYEMLTGISSRVKRVYFEEN